MEKQVKLVCLVVGILGIISTGVGAAAEIRRIKAIFESGVTFTYDYMCLYPSSIPSPALGIIAAVALVFARIILTTAGGCQTFSQYPDMTSIFHSIFSWMASVIAVSLLLAGAIISTRRGVERKSDGTYSCYVTRPGLFAGGAILSFAGVFFGIVFYVNLSSPKKSTSCPSGSGQNPPSVHDIEKPQFAARKH